VAGSGTGAAFVVGATWVGDGCVAAIGAGLVEAGLVALIGAFAVGAGACAQALPAANAVKAKIGKNLPAISGSLPKYFRIGREERRRIARELFGISIVQRPCFTIACLWLLAICKTSSDLKK
jgi:hypothetical protein